MSENHINVAYAKGNIQREKTQGIVTEKSIHHHKMV